MIEESLRNTENFRRVIPQLKFKLIISTSALLVVVVLLRPMILTVISITSRTENNVCLKYINYDFNITNVTAFSFVTHTNN